MRRNLTPSIFKNGGLRPLLFGLPWGRFKILDNLLTSYLNAFKLAVRYSLVMCLISDMHAQ